MKRRRFPPAPPPAPNGMVWRSKGGLAVLVSMTEVEAHSRRIMNIYDSLPRETRDEAKGKTRSQ